MLFSAVPFVAIAALAAYWGITYFFKRQQRAAKAQELGCKEAPLHPRCGIFGITLFQRMLDADKHRTFPILLVDRQNEVSQENGRLVTTCKNHLFGSNQYFTSDPRNIQAMLATQFNDFCLGKVRQIAMKKCLGDGIFVQDGKAWEHSRALIRPNFVRDQVSDLELEERHVQDLLKRLPAGPDGWTAEADIQTLFFRLTIDSATEFLFGESVDSQNSEVAVSGESAKNERLFSKSWDVATHHMARRFRMAEFGELHNPKEFQEVCKFINDFIGYYVDRALKQHSSEKKAEEGRGKPKYVMLDELAKQTRNPEELRGQLLNILLAGRDTTASLLSWVFQALLRHPHVFAKLRSTILDDFGTYENPHDITFSTLKGCQYLQNVMSETLRLWSVVPGNSRRSSKDTTLPRGGGPDGESPIFVPAGTEITYSIHVMHRRKDLWGPDADEFKPERFEGRKPGWEFLPFNGGPRICIGQQFALTEAGYVIVRLLQRYDQIWASNEELAKPIRYQLDLTSAPGNRVTLRLHQAKS